MSNTATTPQPNIYITKTSAHYLAFDAAGNPVAACTRKATKGGKAEHHADPAHRVVCFRCDNGRRQYR